MNSTHNLAARKVNSTHNLAARKQGQALINRQVWRENGVMSPISKCSWLSKYASFKSYVKSIFRYSSFKSYGVICLPRTAPVS